MPGAQGGRSEPSASLPVSSSCRIPMWAGFRAAARAARLALSAGRCAGHDFLSGQLASGGAPACAAGSPMDCGLPRSVDPPHELRPADAPAPAASGEARSPGRANRRSDHRHLRFDARATSWSDTRICFRSASCAFRTDTTRRTFPPECPPQEASFVIVHAGQLNPERPVRVLLDHLQAFFALRPEARSDCRVDLIGPRYREDEIEVSQARASGECPVPGCDAASRGDSASPLGPRAAC